MTLNSSPQRDEHALQATPRQVRMGVQIFTALTIAATAIELAMQRHWKSFEQLIPWFVLGAISIGFGAVVIRASNGARNVARALSLTSLAASLYGLYSHVHNNYETAPLNFRFAKRWDSMSFVSKWWAASTGAVGPSPTLAPLTLSKAAVGVLVLVWLHRSARND